jgi:hypothetical protein
MAEPTESTVSSCAVLSVVAINPAAPDGGNSIRGTTGNAAFLDLMSCLDQARLVPDHLAMNHGSLSVSVGLNQRIAPTGLRVQVLQADRHHLGNDCRRN